VHTWRTVDGDLDDIEPWRVAVDSAGNIVTASSRDDGSDFTAQVDVTRFTSAGVVDATFGTGGTVIIAPAPNTDVGTTPGGLVVEPDLGSYLIAGGTGGSGDMDVTLSRVSGVRVLDYSDDAADSSGADWGTPGAGFFGMCLRTTAGGASGDWPTNPTCASTDGTHWRAIPTAAVTAAHTTALEPDPVDAMASFRFAFRTTSSQQPGRYVAPVTFEVIAPES
jgi:hypothetical protein